MDTSADPTSIASVPRRTGISLKAQQPETYRALVRVATASRKAAREAGLDRRLVELVNLRCSQLNGCGACLDTHTALAVELGESAQRIGVLTAWRETDLFTAQERVALELAEAYTRLPRHDLGKVEKRAREHLDEAQVSAVLSVITAINAFNLITIAAATVVERR